MLVHLYDGAIQVFALFTYCEQFSSGCFTLLAASQTIVVVSKIVQEDGSPTLSTVLFEFKSDVIGNCVRSIGRVTRS